MASTENEGAQMDALVDFDENVLRRLLAQCLTSDTARAGLLRSDGVQNSLVSDQLADTWTQLEVFSAEGDLTAREWLNRLELSKEVGNWSEAKTRSVILAKLAGRARLWHLKNGASLKTFAEWRTKFLDEYLVGQQRIEKFIGDLSDFEMMQKAREPLNVYVWRAAAIAAHRGMSADDVKAQILRGLLPEYGSILHEVHSRTHADIPDLLKDIEETALSNRTSVIPVRSSAYLLHLQWRPVLDGRIPSDAVAGGSSCDDEIFYVIRAAHEGNLIPGRVSARQNALISFNEEVHMKTSYEVLTAHCHPEWIEWDVDKLPSGAIQGGATKMGEPLYIGRVHHDDCIINGYIQLSRQVCLVVCNGVESVFEDFEVLVCPTINFA